MVFVKEDFNFNQSKIKFYSILFSSELLLREFVEFLELWPNRKGKFYTRNSMHSKWIRVNFGCRHFFSSHRHCMLYVGLVQCTVYAVQTKGIDFSSNFVCHLAAVLPSQYGFFPHHLQLFVGYGCSTEIAEQIRIEKNIWFSPHTNECTQQIKCSRNSSIVVRGMY